MGLENEELSGSVISAAIEIHKALGLSFWSRSTTTPSPSSFAKPTLETKCVIASQRPYLGFLASWLP
jgi:hypothetical protein